MSIEIRNLNKHFGNFHVLKDISLDVQTGELLALLGPSGSGKTTLLRIIAGLEFAEEGTITFQGQDFTTSNARNRNVGFVFQHYALFRHMTVFDNVAFGLQVRPRKTRPSKKEIAEKVKSLLELVHLYPLQDRYPAQLSGGQRQRIALARALAVEPKVLLLDEPFGALDSNVRKELRRWLRKLHDEIHITSVFVTHDQEEALEVSDKVVIMNQGKIEQVGVPEKVYSSPENPFVYNFLGNVNLFHGRVEDGKLFVGDVEVGTASHDNTSKVAQIFVRPHQLDIQLHPTPTTLFKAVVKFINSASAFVKVELQSENNDIISVELSQDVYKSLNIKQGSQVYLSPKETKVFYENQAQDFVI